MNREIKFRAWNIERRRMYTAEDLFNQIYFLSPLGARVYTITCGDGGVLNDEFITMQYTGLKDKNGKEIYEGDIFKEKRENTKESFLGIVKYDTCTINQSPCCGDMEFIGWMIEYKKVLCGSYPLNFFNSGIEIIGNIYENPEFLT